MVKGNRKFVVIGGMFVLVVSLLMSISFVYSEEGGITEDPPIDIIVGEFEGSISYDSESPLDGFGEKFSTEEGNKNHILISGDGTGYPSGGVEIQGKEGGAMIKIDNLRSNEDDASSIEFNDDGSLKSAELYVSKTESAEITIEGHVIHAPAGSLVTYDGSTGKIVIQCDKASVGCEPTFDFPQGADLANSKIKDVAIHLNSLEDSKGNKIGHAPVTLRNAAGDELTYDYSSVIHVRPGAEGGMEYYLKVEEGTDGSGDMNYLGTKISAAEGAEIGVEFGPKPRNLEVLDLDLKNGKNYVYLDSRYPVTDRTFGFTAVISNPSVLATSAITYDPVTISQTYSGQDGDYAVPDFNQMYDLPHYEEFEDQYYSAHKSEVKYDDRYSDRYDAAGRKADFVFSGQGGVLVALPRDPEAAVGHAYKADVPKFYMMGEAEYQMAGQGYSLGTYTDKEGNTKNGMIMVTESSSVSRTFSESSKPLEGFYNQIDPVYGSDGSIDYYKMHTLYIDYKGRAGVGKTVAVKKGFSSLLNSLQDYNSNTDPYSKYIRLRWLK